MASLGVKNKDLMTYGLWLFLAVGVVFLAKETGLGEKYLPELFAGNAIQSGGGDTLVLEDNAVGMTVTCYDASKSPSTGGKAGTVQVYDGTTKVLEQDTSSAGVATWATTSGLKGGHTYNVRCLNNSNNGMYEARQDVNLETGKIASPNIAVQLVGDPRITIYNTDGSNDVTLGTNDRKSIKFDLDTDNDQEAYYRPILAFKDNTTNGASVVSEITTITASGGVEVGCDAYAANGYVKCVQLTSQDYVSSANPITGGIIYFSNGATATAGTLDVLVQDGVPFEGVGVGAVNRADAYDTTTATTTIDIA